MGAQGVSVIEIEMPQLAELNGQVGFPVALYEAYDDMVAYLKHTGTGLTIEVLARRIASPDVKGTYDGLVIPRKLPGPDNTLVDAKANLRQRDPYRTAGASGTLRECICRRQAGRHRLPDHAARRDCLQPGLQ
ncbi:hypothetical protein ACVWXO_003819 [Bradyrhizobium sp. LM2.7]